MRRATHKDRGLPGTGACVTETAHGVMLRLDVEGKQEARRRRQYWQRMGCSEAAQRELEILREYEYSILCRQGVDPAIAYEKSRGAY